MSEFQITIRTSASAAYATLTSAVPTRRPLLAFLLGLDDAPQLKAMIRTSVGAWFASPELDGQEPADFVPAWTTAAHARNVAELRKRALHAAKLLHIPIAPRIPLSRLLSQLGLEIASRMAPDDLSTKTHRVPLRETLVVVAAMQWLTDAELATVRRRWKGPEAEAVWQNRSRHLRREGWRIDLTHKDLTGRSRSG